MKNKIDYILKQALAPKDEPDFRLNQRILNQVKENESMKHRTGKRTLSVALVLIFVLGIGSVTTYAAWKYLTPFNVAEKMQDDKLVAAFQSEDAIKVNETQSYGGYDITLLGIVSGKGLSKYVSTSNGQILEDRTYSVTAIAKQDGSPMPEISDDAYSEMRFFVSPLIQGYNPNQYNAVTMNGGYSDIVENGVLYRLNECDNVEVFADKELYLCVMDSTFYDTQAYMYDETTGKISRTTSYSGVNALFSLPLDSKKADAQAAEEYIKKLDSQEEDTEEEAYEETEIDRWMEKITVDNINEYAVPVESAIQTLTPDKEGNIQLKYEVEGHGSGEGNSSVSCLFPDGKPGMSQTIGYSITDDNLDGVLIITYTLNEDGTVTFVPYIPKQ